MSKWIVENTGSPINGRTLQLLTIPQLAHLSTGTEVYNIFGKKFITGRDSIDRDTRGGYTAFGRLLDARE